MLRPHSFTRFQLFSLLFSMAGTTAIAAASRPCEASPCSNGAHLDTCIDADPLWPSSGHQNLESVASTSIISPGEISFGIVTTYLKQPIVLHLNSASQNDTQIPAVDNMVNMTLLSSYGLTKHLQLNLALPWTLYQDGSGVSGITSAQTQEIPTTSVRDVRFGFSYRFPWFQGTPWSTAAHLVVAAPTGDDHWFGGDQGPVWAPSISGAFSRHGFVASAQLGLRLRPASHLATATVGSQAYLSVGAAYPLLSEERLSVTAQTFAAPSLVAQHDPVRDANGSWVNGPTTEMLVPAEWLAGVRSSPTRDGDLTMALSAGTALPITGSSITSPMFRVVATISYAPLGRDADQDGVLDRDDKCPQRAEDRDGFQDADGCPDLDNDRDGIPDTQDRCRDKAEDMDGYQDQDGCPELDDDHDGVPDTLDACRFKPEDRDGFQDDDGCPDVDNDKDGIPDAQDRCPNNAEDRDGYNDADGCPDPDNDGDGVLDAQDQCPLAAEDMDGFQDADGCPDPDNDKDGVPDIRDKCPSRAETIDGNSDLDGCPEPGAKDKTRVTGRSVTVAGATRFPVGSARVTKRMRAELMMVVQRALGQKPLRMVLIETYADTSIDSRRNQSLAERRADAIREVLLSAGFPEKLVSAAAGMLTKHIRKGAPQYEVTVVPARGRHRTRKRQRNTAP